MLMLIHDIVIVAAIFCDCFLFGTCFVMPLLVPFLDFQ